MSSTRGTNRTLDLISQLERCGTRAEAEAIAGELIEMGAEAGRLLSRPSYHLWKGTLALCMKAKVLGEVGPAESVSFLSECLKSKHPGVRRRSAEALSRLCDRAGHDVALRRGILRRTKAMVPILRQLLEARYLGRNIATEPYSRALSSVDRLLSFDDDRLLPIPHDGPTESAEDLPVISAGSDAKRK